MNRRTFLTGAGTTAALALAGCLGAASELTGDTVREEVDRAVDSSGLASVRVDGRVGDVHVHPTDGSDVVVHATKRTQLDKSALERVRVETEQRGGVLTIQTVTEGEFTKSTPSVDLDVGIPQQANLQAESIALDVGDVTVESVAGPLDVESEVGDFHVTDVTGDVRLSAETGDVTVDGVSGFVSAAVEVGDVSIRDADGVDGLRTGVGDLDADVANIRTRTELTADVGNVSLRLPSDFDADLQVEVGAGDIDASGVPLDVDESSNGRLAGTLGDGGPTLSVAANTGDVTLRPLGN